MKFLLIGNGFIAPTHKDAIKTIGGEIIDVIDKDQGENRWREIVKNTKADCIVVLTPNDLHFEMVKIAAEQGKIVLCEKPLVIKSEDLKILAKYPNIFTVLQLRYHPLVERIKREQLIKKNKHEIDIDISVFRDKEYYRSWKGKRERSGGILFNLGIHYFDLLLHLFGKPERVLTNTLDERTSKGLIEGKDYFCHWRISTDEKKDRQRRIFRINEKEYNFSSKDNLSYENLHRFVYQDLLRRKGIFSKEELKSIELIEQLYRSYKFKT